MLKFGKMRWSWVFSYGPDNEIDFGSASLLQLVGKNGHGKSSIPLILEEVLFNKNSKGIKRGAVINRYGKSKSYQIELEFTKDSIPYSVKTVRGSTQTVVLVQDGEDISEHTPSATYKLLEEILGFDHKSFTQIVYQSDPFSLEFLTATDTTRKKFLIDLLDLTRYGQELERFKRLTQELTNQQQVLTSRLKLAEGLLQKYSASNTEPKELVEVPKVDPEFARRIAAVNTSISSISAQNALIKQNETYKAILDSIDLVTIPDRPEDPTQLKIQASHLTKKKTSLNATISGTKVITHCSQCKQPVDSSQQKIIVAEAKQALEALLPELAKVEAEIKQLEKDTIKYQAAVDTHTKWEKYYALVDRSFPCKPLSQVDLEAEKALLTKELDRMERAKTAAEQHNVAAVSHNARIEVILAAQQQAQEEIDLVSIELAKINKRISNVALLVKTFGTSGLVAYKIECSVKDLESLTNEYLLDMSDGRFQLAFKMSSSDKLDVVITDNGNDIDITALSNGELARVNVSCLLAIRKLMQSLSSTRTNLLILDETVESLDVDGKEKLIEVLLKEEHLNTVLVSHGFSHPLLEKVNVVKENNVSRIE